MKQMRDIFESLMEVVLPRTCRLCGTSLPRGEHFLCLKCFNSLPRTHFLTLPENVIEQRLSGLIPFQRAFSFLHYAPQTNVAKLVADFKYRHSPSLARNLSARLAYEIIKSDFFKDIDAVIPVPVHFSKLLRRTYNQSEYLAKGIADATGIPLNLSLKAFMPHRSQTSLSHIQRRSNTIGIFRLANPEKLKGKHLLIVDDVFTTGSTLLACGNEILKRQPDTKISFLTLGFTSNT